MLKSYYYKDRVEAGCDEAGRGSLAGPVCAAAVIMPSDYSNPRLNDSKKLSARKREKLREEIERVAIDFAVMFVGNKQIDEINILKASFLAMHKALDKLICRPNHILIDGNRFYPYQEIPYTCIVKGDGKYASIAAASILAKTYRDDLMVDLHKIHDRYGWEKNKGYPTKMHRHAIALFGPTEYHRRSFQLLDRQVKINFDRNEN